MSAADAPRALGHRPAGQVGFYAAHYAQPPAAPHSLAPVAMSSFGEAGATGPQAAQPDTGDDAHRSRPTLTTGLVILLAGVFIGGLSGVAVRARESAVAAAKAPSAEKAVANATSPNAPNPIPAPSTPYANVPFGSLVLPPATTAPAPSPASSSPATTTTSVATKPVKPTKPVVATRGAKPVAKEKEKDDGYKVASATPDEPKAKPAKEKKPEVKVAKAEKPAKPEKPSKPEKATKAPDDADKILKAAMGATENTL